MSNTTWALEVALHILTFLISICSDIFLIGMLYSRSCFSTNINLAISNSRGILCLIRIVLLALHMQLVQVFGRFCCYYCTYLSIYVLVWYLSISRDLRHVPEGFLLLPSSSYMALCSTLSQLLPLQANLLNVKYFSNKTPH